MLYKANATDTTAVLTVQCDGGSTISVGGVSDTPDSQLDFEIVFVDAAGNNVGETGDITLVAGSTKNWPVETPATLYRGKPKLTGDPSYHCAGVAAFITVSRVTPKPGATPAANSSWTLSAAVSFPPGVTSG